jgi:asparagine synthase (glutamine-hydrolysing)
MLRGIRNGRAEKLRRFAAGLACDFAHAHSSWRDIFAEGELKALMQPAWRASLASPEGEDLFADYFARHFAEVEGCDPIDQATYVDIKTWLADDILVKADRMSMASSIEARCPFLDHRVVEFAAQLPAAYKLRGFSKKHILRESQRGRLPSWVLDRPKQGFNAPISQWLLGPLRALCRDTLFSGPAQSWFARPAVERLWKQHEDRERDNGLKLFGLLTAGLFLQSASAPVAPPATSVALRGTDGIAAEARA